MATNLDVESSWNELNRPAQTGVGTPVDLTGTRAAYTKRGQAYDARGDEQYNWAKDQFAKNAATADTVQTRALDTGASFADYAKRDRALYDRRYMPAMEQQLDYAQQYTTPERMAANRAQAIASGSLAANSLRAASERNLQSIGIDPSSGRYAGLEAGLNARQAAMNAGLATKSDRDTEMMGQQLLANAIKTGQVLPGQAVNEAGVSLAADKEAIDTGLATTASGAQTIGTGLQWSGRGDQALDRFQDSLLAQTKLSMQQNQQDFENRQKQAEAESKSSSGIGAIIGAGAGILGTIYGGPIGGMVGSKLGSMLGGAASGGGGGFAGVPGFGIGGGGSADSIMGLAARGGLIKKMRAGGAVRDVPEPEDVEEEDDARRRLEHRGYRPGRDEDPQMGGVMPKPRAWREPAEEFTQDQPESDTNEAYDFSLSDEDYKAQRAEKRGKWVPNYAEGGAVDDDDDEGGGEGEGESGGEGGLTEEEMEELEDLREMERSGQLNSGSFHEYAGGGRVRRFQRGGLSRNIEDRRNDPPLPQEELYADHPEPTEEERARNRELMEDVQSGRRQLPTYTTRDLQPEFRGPQDDQDFEPRRPRYADGGTVGGVLRDTWGVNAYADGGEVEDPTMVDAEELAATSDVPNMVPPEASPSGGQETDDVHAMLNEGEFVIPKQVVSWHGEKFFQNLIKKAYNEMQQPQVAEPEAGPPQAMAISPPTFASQGG